MSTTIFNKFNRDNIAPYVCDSIGVFDDQHKFIGKIPLTGFKPAFDERRYRFGILADIHQEAESSGTEAYADFKNALSVFENKEDVDFVCTCGDLTQHGCLKNVGYQIVKYAENLELYSKTTPVYSTTGNHDVTTNGIEQVSEGVSAITNWNKYVNYRQIEKTSHDLHYAPTIQQLDGSTHQPISFYFTHEVTAGKKDYFVFLSMRKWAFDSDVDNTYYPEDAGGKDAEELGLNSTWIKDVLDQAENEGARAFVFTHLFFPDKAGNFAEAYPQGNWLTGAQYSYLNEVFNTHKNAIWFSGHSHWKWYLQGADVSQKTSKFLYCNVFHDESKADSGYAVHIPSCSKPIDSYFDGTSWVRDDGEASTKSSEGCVIDVYDEYIDIRGISFKCYWNSGKLDPSHVVHYQPIGTYRIHTDK